jgi:hypothetical protein
MATQPVKQGSHPVQFSNRKREAASLLKQVAVTVCDGGDYGLRERLRPEVTLTQARAAWKPMSASLTAAVIDEREDA